MRIIPCLFFASLLTGCISTKNYHPPGTPSTFHYDFKEDDKRYGHGYFAPASAYEAYVEFDARGLTYKDGTGNPYQLKAALDLIKKVRHPGGLNAPAQAIALYVFIHGWKNNAGDTSGNVWGFRRFLSQIAHDHCGVPTVGVYIGWPGASLKNDAFLSFWNREPVATAVSGGELTDALRSILQEAKGIKYDDEDQNHEKSVAVVIGHSFGGIVLEPTATKLIREQLDSKGEAPADLFLLLNEAGAAKIGQEFLYDLANLKVNYNDANNKPHPLLLSMTSVGDIATKFAYPGAEYLSINRPHPPEKYSPVDMFGQDSSLPYDLLTAANMVALQSHEIVPKTNPTFCDLEIPIPEQKSYCMSAIHQGRLNRTPYWIMQLPQIFVPDHSSVFQDYLLNLLSAVMEDSLLTSCGPRTRVAANPLQPPPPAVAPLSRPSSGGRPRLGRAQ
jgi:hypothetical protein